MLLKQEHLQQALERLADAALLLTPQVSDGVGKFAPHRPGCDTALAEVNMLLPPKDALFPPTEKLYGYQESADGLTIDEQRQEQRQIIFGIRPCDVYSINCMDKVFLENGYVDSFYARKRAQITLIAITCAKAAPTCFCDSMGIDPNNAPLADVELNPLPGGWRVTAHSGQGREVLQLWGGLLTTAAAEEESARCACSLRVDTAGLAEKLPLLFGHPLWQNLARPCLSCGICAYLCPTCHCFDITAESRGRQGAQFRCWDSCMFPEYTVMAGGHNPRPNPGERLANRFLHKLAYFQQRYGQTLCTGCGRCLSKCPVNIQITELITKARGVEI